MTITGFWNGLLFPKVEWIGYIDDRMTGKGWGQRGGFVRILWFDAIKWNLYILNSPDMFEIYLYLKSVFK